MPILSAFPAFCLLLKLGVFLDIINYICLSFVQILADIYFNYINYLGLLFFCFQKFPFHLICSKTAFFAILNKLHRS